MLVDVSPKSREVLRDVLIADEGYLTMAIMREIRDDNETLAKLVESCPETKLSKSVVLHVIRQTSVYKWFEWISLGTYVFTRSMEYLYLTDDKYVTTFLGKYGELPDISDTSKTAQFVASLICTMVTKCHTV